MKITEELKKEQYDAKAKLHEIIELINNEKFYALPKSEQGLINQQRTGLELYLSSLTKRIYGNSKDTDMNNMIWLSMLYGMFNTNGFGSSNTEYLKSTLDEKDFEEDNLTDHAV